MGGGVKKDAGLAIVTHAEPLATLPPIISSFNDCIRPLLDAVDRLRNLQVTKEGIQLPTIVVVGDQSSGKSSVLESLAGISLPRGQGICTRVPLIMRLQGHSAPEPELYLEFGGKVVQTDESNIALAIHSATEEIAGREKGISNTPLTLVVKKKGVPDLTMVDLPGITRVPVQGQPDNIYEQITEMIMEYIRPEESIILNVLSATVDFSTCESIRMSRMVDKTGQRTLAVVTKADRAPEGLLEKVADDVSIGLSYVCVRNRIGDETYEDARFEEEILFDTHPLLSKIDKTIVGIPVLSERLIQIQATIVAKCLPEIVRKINEKLNNYVADLNRMPKNLSNVAEAMTAFMQIMGSARDSLRKILLKGEYDEFPDDKEMHGTARFVEMLKRFSDKLHRVTEVDPRKDFLMEEIKVLDEAKGINLPNFLPRSAFLMILCRKVNGISDQPFMFMAEFWDYVERVVITILMEHSEVYPPLQALMRRAVARLMTKMKERAMSRVEEIIAMEKQADYTCDPEYVAEWNKLMEKGCEFVEAVNKDGEGKPYTFHLQGIGEVEIDCLRNFKPLLHQAYDLRMRMNSYWKIVLRRLVDTMAMFLLYNVTNLVNKEMEGEMVKELVGPEGVGIEKMLEEAPFVAKKREKLKRSIDLLRESAAVVGKIMDRTAAHGNLS